MSGAKQETEARAGPATAMQHGLLYESSLARRPWANLEQIVIEGSQTLFEAERLRAAWTELARRHDALRMILPPDGQGGLFQLVRDKPEVSFSQRDFSALAPVDQQSAVAAFLAEDRLAGTDPLVRPGWRVSLLNLAPAAAVMVWTIHHALIDGQSMAIVLEELAALLAGQPPGPLPEQDFAGFSRRLAHLDKTEAQAFFARMFAGGADAAPLAATSGAGPRRMALVSSRLDADHSAALRRFVGAMGATPLNAVQAVWALVLARWTGRAGACFGLVEAGRRLVPGTERTVGCLISTLPMQVELDGQESLGAVLRRLRQTSLDLRKHSHASLTEVRRWSGLSGQTPMFDTIVMYSHASLEARLRRSGHGLADRPLRLIEEGTATATLVVTDDPEFQILLEYDPGRLPETMAAAITAQVTRLLGTLSQADALTRLADLDMLDEAETARLLALGTPDGPIEAALPCIATRFEAAAAASPDALALIEPATGLGMSFRRLDQAANALARRLQSAAVGPEDVVGLHLRRGADHVTALLAVLKLGAAFLPLDPDLPEDWLAGLARRAGIKALICHGGSALEAPARLDPHHADQAESPPSRPDPQADRLAYLLFTSGSTGAPKAVRGLCGALSAHGSAVISAYGLGPTDRVLHFAGLGFDVALEEILPTLLAGACVVIRDEAAAGSVRGFLDLVAREAITVVNLPASFWHVLVDDMAAQGLRFPPDLRLVIAGSEPIGPQTLRRWRQIAPDVAWINGYGPTEATITATAYALPPGAALPEPLDEVPIGRPLAHARAVLRAFDGSLTPRGGTGMLWIGGAAVSGGYLGDDRLSRDAFQSDPWQPQGRLYRSGDMARWREDNQLAFLGRRDRQIKLRGHRIDLHQLEGSLLGLAGVRQAHAALVGDRAEAARLVAWVVVEDGHSLARIAANAARSLPGYMLPHLVAMDALPVGPNGKIDGRSLQVSLAPTAPLPVDAPHDPLTRTIAACMAEVLDRPTVPQDASFTDLGGDSLSALRLVSLIEKRTGHLLQTANLHHHGSARALARLLQSGTTAPRYTIPIQPEGSRPAFFAVHVLGRNENLFRPLAEALGPDQPMFGLSVGIPQNLDDINVERTARIYLDEIQTYHPEGPVCLGAVSMAAYFAYELAQLLRAAGREVRVLAVLDAMGPDGRPALSGIAKLRAHLQQVRRYGVYHFVRVAKNRLDRYRERREALHSAPDQVNAHNLIAANVCAVEFYQPKPYDGPLTVFRADHSFWDSPQALATGLGWASVARGGLEMFDLPGTHLSILQPGNVEVLAAHLRRLIAKDEPQATRPEADTAPIPFDCALPVVG